MKIATRILKRDDWKITSKYGYRIHPTTKLPSFHSGIDFGTQLQNWNVYGLENGKVIASGYDDRNGNYIWIEYPRVDLKLFHCHLLNRQVSKGDLVNENTVIGQVGKTGGLINGIQYKLDIHLHLGVKHISDDKYFDFENYDYQEEIIDDTKIKVIDISTYQRNIDYAKVKASGIQGAIIRLGYSGSVNKTLSIDEMFETHYKGLSEVGLPIGVYFLSRATTREEAIKEAQFTIKHITNKKIDLPIYWDTEDTVYQSKASKQALTDSAYAYCDYIDDYGYKVGIYGSMSWLENKLDMLQLNDRFLTWIARYAPICDYRYKYECWQYTSSGVVGGINGNCDVNWLYFEPQYSGVWNANFTKLLQKIYKTTQDGIISRQIKQKANENIHKITWGIGGSNLVKAIQRESGYLKVDGYLGKNTIMYLQKKYGVNITGYITKDDELVKAIRKIYGG